MLYYNCTEYTSQAFFLKYARNYADLADGGGQRAAQQALHIGDDLLAAARFGIDDVVQQHAGDGFGVKGAEELPVVLVHRHVLSARALIDQAMLYLLDGLIERTTKGAAFIKANRKGE